jgi:hypothetical protein
MLTVTCDSHFDADITETFAMGGVSQNECGDQFETLPSDAEIARRVRMIRGSWSAEERFERRIEADLRFAELLEQLMVDDAEADAA